MPQQLLNHSLQTSIELHSLSQSFYIEQAKITLFSDLNLSIKQGESYAITGPSGSGKSSLLSLISGLAEPSKGTVKVCNGQRSSPIETIKQKIGFIFQQFHLLPEMNALNNVALPLKLRGDKQALAKAEQYLRAVGLGDRLRLKTNQLSGGEQQRVAIARALVFEPIFIFADEPTGNLDPYSASEITELLFKCCEDNNAGLVLVTHSQKLAREARYQLELSGGGQSAPKLVKTASLNSTDQHEVEK